jgi:hypothetical protein
MTFSLSRVLSLLVVVAEYVRALWIPSGFWIVAFVSGAILVLIWFPAQVDDLIRNLVRGLADRLPHTRGGCRGVGLDFLASICFGAVLGSPA